MGERLPKFPNSYHVPRVIPLEHYREAQRRQAERGRKRLKVAAFFGMLSIATLVAEANWGLVSKTLSLMRTPYEYFFTRPTYDQVVAATFLDDPNTEKDDYIVTDHPDVLSSGGIAARNVPSAPSAQSYEDPTLIRRLSPGTIIEGAIPWSGQNYDRPASTELKNVWLVWKRPDGVVEFIANHPAWVEKCTTPKCANPLP